MVYLVRFILCLFFTVGTVLSHHRADIPSLLPKLEQAIERSIEAWDVPGLGIVIVKDNQIVYLKGFGTKKKGDVSPIDEDTVFQVNSVTKNFTATLMAILVDQGRIRWDDLVIDYLPDFSLRHSDITKQFTIRDLFSHRSGLKGFSGDSLWALGYSPQEIMEKLKLLPITGQFRKSYGYQNILIGLAEQIIEKVSGRKYADLIQEYLFKPLHMTRSSVGLEPLLKEAKPSFSQKIKGMFHKSTPNVIVPHDSILSKDKTHFIARPINYNSKVYTFPSTSGVNSTLSDLAKWLIFQLNNGQPLISGVQIKEMCSPHIQADLKEERRQFPKERVKEVFYGLGWFIFSYGDTTKPLSESVQVLGHMGGLVGARALMSLLPSENIGIMIVSNYGGMRVNFALEEIRNVFFDLYLQLDEMNWMNRIYKEFWTSRQNLHQRREQERLKNPKPPHDLSVYEGVYENSLYDRIEVRAENNSLYLSHPKAGKWKVEPWNGDSFTFKGSDLSANFGGNDFGEVFFGVQGNIVYALTINLLNEGDSPYFKKVQHW